MPRRSIDKWVERLQTQLGYCYNCQPRDDGEYVWVLGDKRSMTDFLSDAGVPEDLHDSVAAGLQCPNCGTQLDLSADIATQPADEAEAEARHDRWLRVWEPKLEEFVKWMQRYPYLGLAHPIGRRIHKELPKFPRREFKKPTIWWRARAVESELILTSKDMGPPPKPPRSEGRFSHHGQRVFYLADQKQVAAAEALGSQEGLAWVQRFRIGPSSKILDLDGLLHPEEIADGELPLIAAGLNWSGTHLAEADGSEWKPQYFLPRFIADCARSQGLKGIIYPSTRFYGSCLVLFEWRGMAIRPVGRASLFQWSRKRAERKLPF